MPARANRGGKGKEKKNPFGKEFEKTLGKVRRDSRQGLQRISKQPGGTLGKGREDKVSGEFGVVVWESFWEGLRGVGEDTQKISERFSEESTKTFRKGSERFSWRFGMVLGRVRKGFREDSRGFPGVFGGVAESVGKVFGEDRTGKNKKRKVQRKEKYKASRTGF
jgi:hypothetical protein